MGEWENKKRGEYGATSYNSHLSHHCKPVPTVTFFIKGPIISPGLGVWFKNHMIPAASYLNHKTRFMSIILTTLNSLPID